MLEQKSPDTQNTQGAQNLAYEQGTLFDRAELERLQGEKQRWEETTVQKSLSRMPEREDLMTTSSVPIECLYTPLG